MIKAVLFDFDGTVADTFGIVIQGVNQTLVEGGYPPITDPEPFRDHSALALLRELKVPFWKLPLFERRVRTRITNQLQEADIFLGMKDIMQTLRENYTVGVVTSNGQDVVDAVLREHKIGVDILHCESSILGKGKVLKRICNDYGWQAHEVLYVGDEIRDIDAARSAGMRVISVTWGYNSKKALQGAKPDALVNTRAELMKAIEKLGKN